MIEFYNVTKAYVSKQKVTVILNDATFVVPRGVNLGILGNNGAGKSTLLRMFSGVEKPDSGEIVRRARISWPIGFSGALSKTLSGEENVRLIARFYGRDPAEICAFVADFSELGDYFQMPINTYSSGMRARLAFAASLAIDFDIYLVDEVISTGDRSFREKCEAAFKMRSHYSTVIMVSHQTKTIEDMCDAVAVMHHGNLHFFDDVNDAKALYEA
ncbi:MAG: ABC transporter ATP-binding protein [Neomegalonema sp.]|nr:ABC transporter ATP-binding protein [Neomegalonema sp.]